MVIRLLITFLFLVLAMPLAGRDVTVELAPNINIDEAGRSLRQAINAYEAALVDPAPTAWTRVRLTSGQNFALGKDKFLMLLGPSRRSPDFRIMYVDQNGPQTAELGDLGEEVTVGPLRVLPLILSSSGETAEVMIKSAEAPGVLQELAPGTSSTKIRGLDRPTKRIVVESPNGNILDFSQRFLQEFNRGRSAEQAARLAQEHVPPIRFVPNRGAMTEQGYTDPVNFAMDEDNEVPFGAGVTLHLVRADSETLNQLSSELAYDSSGRDNRRDPRVQGSTGEEGGEVIIGNPGDRFRARLRVLERESKADIEGETYVRVPFDEEGSLFEIAGGGRTLSAIMTARRVGQRGVNLRLDNQQGDWGFLGNLRTAVRINDGQTVLLARNNYSREETQESQVPILGDIPYLGPIFGSESRRTVGSNYALFATMELQ